MSKRAKPLSRALLRKFAAGELEDTENEAIMMQLAEDEASLEFVDALWQEQQSHPTAVFPELGVEQTQEVRRRIVHQIHRSDLAKNVVSMGTRGFGSVAIGLLRPLLDSKNAERRNRRRPKGND